jgi:hypothetical protein
MGERLDCQDRRMGRLGEALEGLGLEIRELIAGMRDGGNGLNLGRSEVEHGRGVVALSAGGELPVLKLRMPWVKDATLFDRATCPMMEVEGTAAKSTRHLKLHP